MAVQPLDAGKDTPEMESQFDLCKTAPTSLCSSCWREAPQFGKRRVARHVNWSERRKPHPRKLLRMSACLLCSTVMTVVDSRDDGGDMAFLELPILSSRRAMKRPGGYDWEECYTISLMPIWRYTQYSSPSGCTDLGFIAMMKAQDENYVAPTEAKRALDFEYIRELASMCTEQHGKTCMSTAGPHVPNLRVIDCTTGSVVDAPNDCHYLALSYVWGDPSASAADDTGAVFKPLICDSITITQKLGFRYLWVDRHCIDQDDAYKHTMISRMGDVYSQAHITIVIATARGANERISHLDGVNQALDVYVEGQIATRVFTHVACALGESKWASRAWTFQEGYLSPRRLIFTEEDVFFLCNHSFAAESSKVIIQHETLRQAQQSDIYKFIPVDPRDKSAYSDKAERLETLEKHISEFSKRQLSYESDSLNALLGVLSDATKERHYFPLRHLWGIPYHGHDSSLLFSLHWKHHAVAQRRPAFPSWSWCGWSGGVSFEHREFPISYESSVCLFSVRPPTGGPVALWETVRNPIPASNDMPPDLLIKTRIVPFRFAPEAERTPTPSPAYAVFQVDEDSFARVPAAMDEAPLASGTRYVGIFLEHELSRLKSTEMIMLLAKAVDDHYERVGIVKLHSEESSLSRWYVSNGQRPLDDRYKRELWFCVQFDDVEYVDRQGKSYDHFKPDELPLQPWYRDAEIQEICLR